MSESELFRFLLVFIAVVPQRRENPGPFSHGPVQQEPKPDGACERWRAQTGRRTSVLQNQRLELASSPLPAVGVASLPLLCSHGFWSFHPSAAVTLDPGWLYRILCDVEMGNWSGIVPTQRARV